VILSSWILLYDYPSFLAGNESETCEFLRELIISRIPEGLFTSVNCLRNLRIFDQVIHPWQRHSAAVYFFKMTDHLCLHLLREICFFFFNLPNFSFPLLPLLFSGHTKNFSAFKTRSSLSQALYLLYEFLQSLFHILLPPQNIPVIVSSNFLNLVKVEWIWNTVTNRENCTVLPALWLAGVPDS